MGGWADSAGRPPELCCSVRVCASAHGHEPSRQLPTASSRPPHPRRLGFIARGGTWSPATHHRWPEAFKAAARTLLLAASSAGAQAAAERHGGGAAAECAAKRRRRQRAAHSVRDERGGGLAALPGSALMRVLELAAMPVSDWL